MFLLFCKVVGTLGIGRLFRMFYNFGDWLFRFLFFRFVIMVELLFLLENFFCVFRVFRFLLFYGFCLFLFLLCLVLGFVNVCEKILFMFLR